MQTLAAFKLNESFWSYGLWSTLSLTLFNMLFSVENFLRPNHVMTCHSFIM